MNDLSTPSSSRYVKPSNNARSEDSSTSKEMKSSGSDKDIWKWATTAPDAIARCFVQDVFTMVEAGGDKTLHYFLGRIPCRKVRLVGTLVGIVPYEKRTVYTVDDGTGVIDCSLPHSSDDGNGRDISSSPQPVADRGSTVKVIGNIRRQRNLRMIHSDSIHPCSSTAQELEHWQDVLRLHESFYFISTPFVIPSSMFSNTDESRPSFVPPRTPKRPRAASRLSQTPTSVSVCSATPSSLAYSPAKSISTVSSPVKLRRPAHLSSRELKPNTFKIYVKYYMDNIKFPTCRSSDDACAQDPDAAPLSDTLNSLPTTTKRPRTGKDDRTPRLSRGYNVFSSMLTPRASADSCSPVSPCSAVFNQVDSMRGSTISHLRRVPELSLLALRIVDARRREDAKKAKAKGENKVPHLSRKDTAQKMKQLFKWAVTQLLREGSIVMWNGPVHCAEEDIGLSRLWKIGDSSRDTSTSMSSSRSRLRSSQALDIFEDGVGDVSDPEEDEDSYVPLTTAYLAQQVEIAMQGFAIMKGHRQNTRSSGRPTVPAVDRRHRPSDPTKEDIQRYLSESDERWRFVTAWAVQEAFDYLKEQDRVWRVSNRDGGRWELVHQ